MKLRPVYKYKIQRWLHQFYLRYRVAYRVLFKEKHIVAIYFTEQDLEDLICEDKLLCDKINVQFAGCMEHHGLRIIKEVANRINDADIICDKVLFDIEATEILNKKK